jgi:mono/diheme cytochrome c family protein
MKTIANAAACVVLLAGGFAATAGAGQQTGPASPPPVVESMYGPDLYRHYCATCHGRDGKGAGPAAKALNVPPSDLTILARREKGIFPASVVETIIRGGTAVAAHGSVEMPVWGPIFYALDPSDARVKARIGALVSHIATIQQK